MRFLITGLSLPAFRGFRRKPRWVCEKEPKKMRFFTVGIALPAFRSFSTKGFSKPSYHGSSFSKQKKSTSSSSTTTLKKRQKTGSRIQWTEEQKSVLSAVTQGKSVFITGSAGTGKTKLVTEVIKQLKKLHSRSEVFVTASTGVAASAIKGQTLHSFADISHPLEYKNPDRLLESILSNRKACWRWQKAKVLVMDEASMIDPELFDSLEYVARVIRDVDQRWGGIQSVVVGDFCQLPPVHKGSEVVKYAFEADCWDESFDLQIQLTKVFRQSDLQFIELLQGIRMGEIDRVDFSLLERCSSEAKCDPSAVKLFPLKKNVSKVNEDMLRSLKKDVLVYRAIDNGKDPWKRQLKQGIAPDVITICEGARVMLVRNLHTWKGLVNGATGTVMGFVKSVNVEGICVEKLIPVVKFDSGKVLTIEPEEWRLMDGDEVVAWRKQIPLILAWALSIHKCQGMSLDKAYINLNGAFGPGMVYTAVSRVKSLDGLHLSGFEASKILVDPKVSVYYRNLANKDTDNSCIKNELSSINITGSAEVAGTAIAETKYNFSLAEFLARRKNRS